MQNTLKVTKNIRIVSGSFTFYVLRDGIGISRNT